MKKTGERVAVKLQYIDLQDRFTGDMLTMRMILYALGKLFPKFDFAWMLTSVTKNLENELNFKLEGENAERCYNQLSPYLKFLYVPKIIWDYTSSRVLVMEFIEGFKVSEVEKIKNAGLSLKDVDTKIVEAMAFQIFHSGFVHADPHVNFKSLFDHLNLLIPSSSFSLETFTFDQIPILQTNPQLKLFFLITDCTKVLVVKNVKLFVNCGNRSF